MKYFTTSLLSCIASLISLTAFSQVKIGDNATNVNVNSLLELESTNKGLLLPRLTITQINAMTNVPAGMLVFNSTDSALYLRRDTGWAVLALSSGPSSVTNKWATKGDDIYSTNTGKVGIGTNAPLEKLDVRGTVKATRFSGNGSGLTGIKVMQVSGAAPINNPFFTGDIHYSGTAFLGVQYVSKEYSIPANNYGSYSMGCPTGTKLIGGGGGHRDYNDAATSIQVLYSGPDIDDNNNWRLMVDNTAGDSRALIVYAICANVQ